MKELLKIALDFTEGMKDSNAVDTIAFACLIAVSMAVLIIFMGGIIGIVKRIIMKIRKETK